MRLFAIELTSVFTCLRSHNVLFIKSFWLEMGRWLKSSACFFCVNCGMHAIILRLYWLKIQRLDGLLPGIYGCRAFVFIPLFNVFIKGNIVLRCDLFFQSYISLITDCVYIETESRWNEDKRNMTKNTMQTHCLEWNNSVKNLCHIRLERKTFRSNVETWYKASVAFLLSTVMFFLPFKGLFCTNTSKNATLPLW